MGFQIPPLLIDSLDFGTRHSDTEKDDQDQKPEHPEGNSPHYGAPQILKTANSWIVVPDIGISHRNLIDNRHYFLGFPSQIRRPALMFIGFIHNYEKDHSVMILNILLFELSCGVMTAFQPI